VNTSEAAVLAAIDGAGFARVMSYKMDDAMRAGKLAIVLEEFEPKPFPVHLLYTRHKPMPLKLRAFLNWMTPRLKDRLTFLDQQGGTRPTLPAPCLRSYADAAD
jgi:DNA-binding transcriptional LysR family regulator